MGNLRQAELECAGDQNLMLMGVKANGALKGRLLVMSLEQRFRNHSDTNAEITYTFPLPFGAVLMGVEVVLNGKQLTGEVTARSTAREKYEEAISEGNSSIMLERNDDLSYTLDMGNLLAREECVITVRYAQVLNVEQGQIRLMLPTTIAPRYGNPLTQGGLQPHQTTVTDIGAEYPFDITVTLYGDLAKANVASPSHTTAYQPYGEELVVRLSQRGAMDRDFILTLDKLQNQSNAIACADSSVEGQTAIVANLSPLFGTGVDQPVCVKVLVDCSGSMGGDSIAAAKLALHEIVQSMQASDKFSLSRFGDSVEHRSRGLWGGTPQAKASGKRWVDAVEADMGGTEMAEALRSTFAISHRGAADVLLITDGEIQGIDEVIAVAVNSKHRVFVVGIGGSPAEAHLRRLAFASGGACDFVAPGEDVSPAVLRMFSRLRCSRATGLRLEWPQGMAIHWQQPIPTQVFNRDTLAVCAFVGTPAEQSKSASVRLWGCLDASSSEVLLAQAQIEFTQSSVNTPARMVAWAQIASLQPTSIRPLGNSEMSDAQLLAVQYQLVTDQTNFILVHERAEDEKAEEMPTVHKVPQMLAAGWGATGSVRKMNSSVAMRFRAPTVGGSLGDMSAPSVWRKASSGIRFSKAVDAMEAMDDYEVPAFLRKQADTVAFSNKPVMDDRGETLSPFDLFRWMDGHRTHRWPVDFDGLRDIGVAASICEWLEFNFCRTHAEQAVVKTFLEVVLHLQPGRTGLLQKLSRSVRAVSAAVPAGGSHPALFTEMLAQLQGLQADTWPQALAQFPQVGVV